jgi:hypothetical protein
MTLEVERDEDNTQDRLEHSRSKAGRLRISNRAQTVEAGCKRLGRYRQCGHSGLETGFGNQGAYVLEDKQRADVEAGTVDLSDSSDLSQIWPA